MRFDKKGKLSPRNIGSYQTVRKIGKVAYELDLPSDFEAVHPVCHMSMLHKCIGDSSRVFPTDDIQMTEKLSYEEQPMVILNRQVKRLCAKGVASVSKVDERKSYSSPEGQGSGEEGIERESSMDIEESEPQAMPQRKKKASKIRDAAGEGPSRVSPAELGHGEAQSATPSHATSTPSVAEEHDRAPVPPAPQPPAPPPAVPDQDLRDAVQLLTRLVATQTQRQAGLPDRAVSSRVRDFLTLDPPIFTGTNSKDDPQNFVDRMGRALRVMHASDKNQWS
ncbi:uncharacterized protein LOC132038049 [Lycium ferocissimum]|uniref:uncharacterized protein LOC132038049 n=1 Tax=Lycium ferocissimum TaxID=112874 RepID=UPI002816838C|nr:uncharacterized protein LOC132038049 [Lycium ferocissimum]